MGKPDPRYTRAEPYASQQMENLQQPKYWRRCVLTCATQPLFSDSFAKAGVIWTLTRTSFFFCLLYLLTMYHHCSKELNANQIAFAIKKYKSQRQVGPPSEIIAHVEMQPGRVSRNASVHPECTPTQRTLFISFVCYS